MARKAKRTAAQKQDASIVGGEQKQHQQEQEQKKNEQQQQGAADAAPASGLPAEGGSSHRRALADAIRASGRVRYQIEEEDVIRDASLPRRLEERGAAGWEPRVVLPGKKAIRKAPDQMAVEAAYYTILWVREIRGDEEVV